MRSATFMVRLVGEAMRNEPQSALPLLLSMIAVVVSLTAVTLALLARVGA